MDTLTVPESVASPGLDIAREERMAKCIVCRDLFGNVAMTLDSLKDLRGRLGLEVRDTLKHVHGIC